MGAPLGNRNAAGKLKKHYTGMAVARTWLSPRQMTVMKLLQGGCRPVDICKMLGITINTYNNHVANVKERLDVDTIQEAVAIVSATSKPSPRCSQAASQASGTPCSEG